jgi:perosamine synthetase
MRNLARIPITRPWVTEEDISIISDAARNGWGEHCYEYVQSFEKEFAKFIGSKYAISTSSCTGALHMGLAALGIGPGDEVIIADTNWIASLAPVLHLGASPVFVDIRPDTWCINHSAIAKVITPNTKAIIAVHLYGNLCHMNELIKLGEKYNIPIIEDAAEAIGAIYEGHKAGSLGKFGVFSFHGTKTLTTGEGGMFVTNDPHLYETVLTLSNHGRSRSQKRQFWPDMLGFKYKMSNLQAALGCSQLRRIDSLVTRRREILNIYKDAFSNIECIRMNEQLDNTLVGAWMPTIEFSSVSGIFAEDVLKKFVENNIDARPFFAPLSTIDWIKYPVVGQVSNSLYMRAVNLPSFHEITFDDLQRVICVVKSVVNNE